MSVDWEREVSVGDGRPRYCLDMEIQCQNPERRRPVTVVEYPVNAMGSTRKVAVCGTCGHDNQV